MGRLAHDATARTAATLVVWLLYCRWRWRLNSYKQPRPRRIRRLRDFKCLVIFTLIAHSPSSAGWPDHVPHSQRLHSPSLRTMTKAIHTTREALSLVGSQTSAFSFTNLSGQCENVLGKCLFESKKCTRQGKHISTISNHFQPFSNMYIRSTQEILLPVLLRT